MSSAPIAFEVFLFDRGRFVGSRIFAGARQVTIGRAHDATLRLEDPLVSGRHAVLFVKDGNLQIGDDGSSNGVFVNGRRVQVERVGPLDEIRLGESRIKVEIIGDDAAEAIPAPERTQAGLELTAGPGGEAAALRGKAASTPHVQVGPAPAAIQPTSPPAHAGAAPPARPAPFSPGPASVPILHRTPGPPVAIEEAAARGVAVGAPPPAAAPESVVDDAFDPSMWSDVITPAKGIPVADAPVEVKVQRKAVDPGPPPASRAIAESAPPSERGPRAASATPPGAVAGPDPAGAPAVEAGPVAAAARVAPHNAAHPAPTGAPAVEADPAAAATSAASAPAVASAGGIAAMLQETNAQLAQPEPKAGNKKRPSGAKAAATPQQQAAPVADDSELALPYPPSPPEIDEEAEEERNFVPTFSLLESLVLDSGDAGTSGIPMVEILRYRGDRLLDAGRVDPGGTYEVVRGEDGKNWRIAQLLKKGGLRLFFRKDDTGNLMIGGQRTTLAALADDAHLFHKKKGIYAVDLDEGDRAQIWIDGAGFYIRPVRAPRPPPKDFSFKVSKEDQRYAFAGVAGIMVMLAAIWVQTLISPPELIVMEEEAQFAEISLKDLEMEKPPEPPPPPPPAPPAEVQAEAPPPQAPAPTPQPRRQPRARASAGPAAAQPAAAPPPSAADNALAALAGIAPTGESKLNAAVSNIAAVRAPTGTSSTFAVSGAIGKVPGDEVSLSRGGKAGGGTATGRETRAAAAVLAGTNVGQVGGGGGTGKVRGRVTTAPARSVGTTGGSLSKDAIAKVVAAATSRVQSCYERELIGNPGLQGKITFEWVISPEGSVSSSRVSSSSLPSQAVATCISGVIRGLQFPKPSGGSVSVTYPFAFASQGF